MTRLNKLTALAAAVALSGGLAACGGGGGGLTDTSMMPTPEEMCQTAGGRYNDDGTCSSAAEVQVEELQAQIAALRTQLGLAPSDDIGTSITELQNELAALQTQVDDAADDAADAADKAAMEAAEAEAAAMAATAAKLYAGIGAQMGDGDLGSPAANDRDAGYNDAGTSILVSIGGADGSATAANTLSADDDTMVADNHGWAGTRYADAPGGDMVEAVVYSNVEAPMMGKKFGSMAANDKYEYVLTEGALTFSQINDNSGRVVLAGVTRTSGTETFNLPDPNPNNEQMINVSGSFHGVSGAYSCDTGNDRVAACTAAVAIEGFTLTGTWTFTPGSAEARVMDGADTMYASYGWWLRKAANDGPFTASAFVDVKGTVTAASDLDTLNGTATYVGGAAGKYALASSTGGTNDAGHFTARATLEADFTNNAEPDAITGTIDMFIGADGMSRDWEVALKGSTIGGTGMIGNDGMLTTSPGGTVWTIGEAAADADGQWSGSLLNQTAVTDGGDGVPQVATGTFYTEYGTAGKMVGAFGANKQ